MGTLQKLWLCKGTRKTVCLLAIPIKWWICSPLPPKKKKKNCRYAKEIVEMLFNAGHAEETVDVRHSEEMIGVKNWISNKSKKKVKGITIV